MRGVTLVVKTRNAAASYTGPLREAIQDADRSLAVFDVRTMESHLRDALIVPRLAGALSAAAGGTSAAGTAAEAVSRGVFGVPSMEVGDELFWGYDDFPFLDLFLAGKDPFDAAEWRDQSRTVRASSKRRQFRSTKEGA